MVKRLVLKLFSNSKRKIVYWKRQRQNPLLCGYIFEYHCCKTMLRCDCAMLHCDINDYSKSVKINNILFMISSWKVINKVRFQQKNSSKYCAVIRAKNMLMFRFDIPVFSILKLIIVLFNSSKKSKQPFNTNNRKKLKFDWLYTQFYIGQQSTCKTLRCDAWLTNSL